MRNTLRQTALAAAILGASLAGGRARADLTLVLQVAPGVDLDNLAVGQSFEVDLVGVGHVAGEMIIRGGGGTISEGANLTFSGSGIGPGLFDDLTTNPVLFEIYYTANAPGSGAISTSGTSFETNFGSYPDLSGGPLAYTVVAVPEPSSLALCGLGAWPWPATPSGDRPGSIPRRPPFSPSLIPASMNSRGRGCHCASFDSERPVELAKAAAERRRGGLTIRRLQAWNATCGYTSLAHMMSRASVGPAPPRIGAKGHRAMHVLDERTEAGGAEIRDRVRSALKAHGTLLGESWDSQADHAGRVVAEIVESQGIEAGRRWAQALLAELRADRQRETAPGPAGSDDRRLYNPYS